MQASTNLSQGRATFATRLACLAITSVFAACGGGSEDTASPGLQTSSQGSGSDPDGNGSGAITGTSTADPAFVAKALEVVNAARAQPRNCGANSFAQAAPLQWDARAEQAAIGHSEWMSSMNVLTHTGAGGSDSGQRLRAAGYEWSAAGENVAADFPDIESVVDAWLRSTPHCANIMNPAFTELALGHAQGQKQYWTLVLARPL